MAMKRTSTLTAFLLLTCTSFLAAGDDDKGWNHPFETDDLRVPRLDTSSGALIRNVTIHDALRAPFVGDVLVRDGDIAAIGENLAAPEGVTVIDGTGKHLAPGVVDVHSHIAIERGINEGSLSITADCDISDSINADDPSIYRALAGGVTTIQCLHGSANTIGGRSEVIKLRFQSDVEALRFPDAPQGIKFALGENVMGGGGRGGGGRFPGTRMGVETLLARAFTRAQEYRDEWAAYRAAEDRGEDPAPPRRDVRLDVLVGIIEGDVRVHSHCYRADEILMLLRVAERFGFRIQTLQHVLEAYKVAPEIAAHGAGSSTFSDWWAYKMEAYDAIPSNAALLDEAGAVSTINSDSDEMMRRLYQEAAKSVRYGNMDPVRALRLATLNGATQLEVQDRIGSIEEGKDADLVLLNGDPLSIYARVEWTMVDGKIEFQRRDAFGLDEDPAPVRAIGETALIEAAFDPEGGELLAITGGTVHPVTSPVLEDCTLLIQDGRIVAMGPDLAIPATARVIDATGRHVWPGMIGLDTPLGLEEIDSIRVTNDSSEIGGNQPDVRVTPAIHPASAVIPVTRSNGITRAQVSPQGGGPIQGQSSVIRLTGDTWEELLVTDRDMLHIRFPSVSNDAKDKKEPEAVAELTRLFEEARDYDRLLAEAERNGVPAPAHDPRLAALVPFARGEKRIALHANNAQTLLYAIKFAKEHELDVVLYGATEGWKVADAIARSGLAVVVGPTLTTPSSRYDPYDAPYANAAVLARAGVPLAIMAREGSNARNLPFHAGMAAGFGLPREEALRAVTYYPAQVLGLDEDLGSLAVGKIADVVITDGDILEPATHVTHVLIDGRLQDTGNRQTELYGRYRERLLRLQNR